MIYLKLTPEDLKNASRDKRELSVAKELGYDIRVIGTTIQESDFEDFYNGYDVFGISTKPTRQSSYMKWLRKLLHWDGAKFYLKFVFKAWETDAAIISGRNWQYLLIAYIANLFKWRKAKLVYDSHEFELYRYAPSRTKLQRERIKLVEGFLIRRVELALMVGDKIADSVQEIYQLKTRPTVVRNIPPYWYLAPEKSAVIRQQFFRELKLSRHGFLLMYHGLINFGRGLEYAIRALPFLPEDIGLVIMGYESVLGMIETLQGLAEEQGVIHRVFFHPAVPVTELKDYIGAVDVELILIEGKCCVSYEYSLPNKFFESIQACVPMICADLPEMGQIVRQYDIGLLVNEDDENSVAEAVMKLRKDKKLYNRLKKNMETAKEELCWEKESLKLKAAIQEMMGEVE